MIAYGAREAAGLNQNLTLRSLIVTRFVSSFVCYFLLSVRSWVRVDHYITYLKLQLFYSLVTLAFQLDFTKK